MQAPFERWDRRKRNAYWVMEHVLGSRVSGALVGEARERVEARMASTLAGHDAQLEPVPRVRDISAEAFVSDYLSSGRPVVLEGAARDWPAVQRWSPAFFAERFGEYPVRLLHMAPEDAGQGRYDGVDTTLGEALARLDEGNAAYCRFLRTLMDHADLQGDLDMDWLSARRGPLSPPGNLHLFIGGAGTETGAHSAVPANLFVQVHGRKRWKIYDPSWSPVFRPPMERAMYFATTFDPDRPDYERYPEARHLRGYEVELEPGDVLYNPPFWWHKVSNPTVSIGVGFRWFPPHMCFRASPTQWLLTYLSLNPPFWVGLQLKLDFTKIFTTRWTS